MTLHRSTRTTLATLAAGFFACQSAPPPAPPEATPTPEPQRYGPLGRNLLVNPGFENRLVDWHVPLGASWARDGGVEGSGALVLHAPKPPDDRAIYETVVSQCVVLKKGERFGFSARFLREKAPEKAPANRANVYWYESLNCAKGGHFGDYLEPKDVDGWQEVSRTGLAPALGSRSAEIRIVQQGRYSAGGRATWDDVRFFASEIFEQSDAGRAPPEPLPPAREPGTNYVSNGDFARDLVGWDRYWKAEWSASEGRKAPGALRLTAHSEGRAVGTLGLSQCVDLGANPRFELGASVRRDEQSSQDGGARLRIAWYEHAGCTGRARIDTSWADPEKRPGWQDLRTRPLSPPHDARSAKVELIQSVAGAGEFSLFWDDVYFVALE